MAEQTADQYIKPHSCYVERGQFIHGSLLGISMCLKLTMLNKTF
jgi:hypothetical protein